MRMPDPGAVERTNARIPERAPAAPEHPVERAPSLPMAGAHAPIASVAAPIIPDLPHAAEVQKTPLREDIEVALADGLESAYAALSPDDQAKFRQVGEALAGMLETMLARGEIDLRKTHRRILDWLKLLPARGKFFAYFLIQEAKVKTDAILALARRARGQ